MILRDVSPKKFIVFITDLIKNRELILALAKKDLKERFISNYMGILWAFIHPAVTIFMLWFIFSIGFKSKPTGDGTPFILWLACGMIPWFFISECLSMGTGSIVEKSFLVKKVVFRVSVLPIVKIMVALVVHLFFVFIIFAMFIFHGYPLSVYYLQVFYFVFCAVMIMTGLCWLTSALNVFIKDVSQLVSVFLQVGFWATPIFWSLDILPEKYQVIMKLNPFYYITEGFRFTFIKKEWFFEHMNLTLYFWGVTIIVWILGAIVFRRLRPHFADVL
ncbi:ABC transporter permease [Thermodesulfobacteriota bacterium]